MMSEQSDEPTPEPGEDSSPALVGPTEAETLAAADAALNLDAPGAALNVPPPVLEGDFAAGAAGAPSPPAGLLEKLAEAMEELADDMLELLRRMETLEQGEKRQEARLEQTEARINDSARALGHALDTQRRELLGDRKNLLARGLFNVVVAHVDSLRGMREGLQAAALAEVKTPDKPHVKHGKHGKDHRFVSPPAAEKQGQQQLVKALEAIENSLLTAIQGLGFREFKAREGEKYDPRTMECLEYATGPPGVVLKAVRTGFLAHEGGVARPAGVLIADPTRNY